MYHTQGTSNRGPSRHCLTTKLTTTTPNNHDLLYTLTACSTSLTRSHKPTVSNCGAKGRRFESCQVYQALSKVDAASKVIGVVPIIP